MSQRAGKMTKTRTSQKKLLIKVSFGRSPVSFLLSCIAVILCPTIVLDVAIGHLGKGTWFLELNFSFVSACDHQ